MSWRTRGSGWRWQWDIACCNYKGTRIILFYVTDKKFTMPRTVWPARCDQHGQLRLAWCLDCRKAVCKGCVEGGSCGSHHTTKPGNRGGEATMVPLGDRMVEFWGPRGIVMEAILASPGYTDAVVEWGPRRLSGFILGPQKVTISLYERLLEEMAPRTKAEMRGRTQGKGKGGALSSR